MTWPRWLLSTSRLGPTSLQARTIQRGTAVWHFTAVEPNTEGVDDDEYVPPTVLWRCDIAVDAPVAVSFSVGGRDDSDMDELLLEHHTVLFAAPHDPEPDAWYDAFVAVPGPLRSAQ